MKFKSLAGLLALSFVVSTSVSVVAAQPTHPTKLSRLARRKGATRRVACRETLFGTCVQSHVAIASPAARYTDGPVGNRGPRSGALAKGPVPGGVCDAGDNPFIC
jgi:hypothetical protein